MTDTTITLAKTIKSKMIKIKDKMEKERGDIKVSWDTFFYEKVIQENE